VSHPRVEAVAGEARAAIGAAAASAELEAIRIRYLGRSGEITQILKSLGTLAPQERREVGAAANEAKRELETLLDERLEAARAAERRRQRERERPDLTLPGRRPPRGVVHPLMRVREEIVTIFTGLGFAVAEGPQIETDAYNFEALNIPRDHPARDMQDTFYLSPDTLLRTHTSPVQIRTMRAQKPPVRVICPGVVYRRDADITHSPMFHQVEGLAVDRDVTMADLKGTLELFAREMFGPRSKIRVRRSSRSPSHRRRWMSSAFSARARAVASASSRAGSRSSARAWCTLES
jgi:phenylalanyl-tRNA synthetase alpha chain